MLTGLILVLIVGTLGYLGTIYTSPALVLLSISCGVMLVLGYGYMMLRVKCRIQIPIVMAEQEEGVMICAVTENRSRLPLPKVVYRMDYRNSFGRKKRKLSLQAAADAKSSSRMSMWSVRKKQRKPFQWQFTTITSGYMPTIQMELKLKNPIC